MALRANPDHLNVTLDKWTCERKDGRDLVIQSKWAIIELSYSKH